ncbi:MAG: DMT family transporter [Pseudomonadota bacterium]
MALSRTTQSVLLILFSVALLAALSLMGKMLGTDVLGDPLHPMQVSGARFTVALMCLLLVVRFNPVQFNDTPWRLHIKRSIAGWCGVTCLFAAVTVMPLADANAVSFLSVIVAMGLSMIMLRERTGPYRWAAAVIALLGALIITRPGTTAFQPAALIAVAAAVFIGFEMIFIKQLSGREAPMRILLINNTIGTSISIIAVSFVWQTPSPQQWLFMCLIGSLMLGVQYTNILAMQRSDASFIAPFWYATPAFAALYDFLVFAEVLSLSSMIGISLIIAGGVVISWREGLAKKRMETESG